MTDRTSLAVVLFLVLIAYCIVVAAWALYNEMDYWAYALHGLLPGEYQRYYLPFPVISSAEPSYWGGGPTRINPMSVLLDVALPIMIILAAVAMSKLSSDAEQDGGGDS